LPVAASERRERSLDLNGSLDDWDAADAIQLDQPLVKMLNRPALQHQEIQPATVASSLYSCWSDDNFYIAFRLNGVTETDVRSTHNFVDYQSRRAWGEDLCELLIQPVYVDNTTGPVLHIVCKPSGNWVERTSDSVQNADSWEPLEGAGVRFASTVDLKKQI